jgi:hypothetical protein
MNDEAPEYGVHIQEKPIGVRDEISLVGVREGMSKSQGTRYKFKNYYAPQHSRGGALALVEQGYDKDRDLPWYTKVVTDCETGEVIHDGSEPLANHKHKSTK